MTPTRIPTSHEEAVSDSPRCNIWWFLLISGAILVGWLGYTTLKASSAERLASDMQTKADVQYLHIIYRLDQLDKKLDGHKPGGG